MPGPTSTRNDLELRALIDALTAPPKPPAPPSGNGLLELAALLSPPSPPRRNALTDLAWLYEAPASKTPSNALDLIALGNALTRPPTPPTNALRPVGSPPMNNALGGLFALGAPALRPSPAPVAQPTARKVFFSFHYDDVMRVNNVRNILKFQRGAAEIAVSFYDRSLWEKTKRTNPDGLKQLIREGVKHSSVVCVLVGTETWSRPWVRYEIARGVVDGKGLLAVHVNSINHHQHRVPHARGPEPLMQMAVGLMRDGTFRLFEWRNNGWYRYEDYTQAVPLPRYLTRPEVDKVIPLGTGAFSYDFALQNGAKNLGQWVALAADRAGR